MAQILIADDEKNILEAMIDVLENEGHTVTGVSDGIKAFELLSNKPFDVAILDVMMPKMDGYHVASKIRVLSSPPKVIIVTARDFDSDKNAVMATGADAFLPKPFSNKDLVDVVSKLLKEKAS